MTKENRGLCFDSRVVEANILNPDYELEQTSDGITFFNVEGNHNTATLIKFLRDIVSEDER